MGYYDWRRDIEDCWETMNSDEAMEVAYEIARNDLIRDGEDENDPDFDERVMEESDYIGMYRIATNSALYSLIEDWYANQGKNMEDEIRGYYEDYYGDYIYFVTGCGYSILSADLLGGSSDGRAEQEFAHFVEERM